MYDFAKLVVEEREKRANSRYTEQCKEYIRKYYHQKICILDIAEALGVSESHLSRIFKKEMGESIRNIVCIRIERAEKLTQIFRSISNRDQRVSVFFLSEPLWKGI